MIKIINKQTKAEVNSEDEIAILRIFYRPCYGAFLGISEIMNATLKKYRNAKLIPYKLTEFDKRRIAENPEVLEDLPRMYVPRLDKEISSDKYEAKLKKEFLARFKMEDPVLIKCLNQNSKYYHIDVVED
jgi:hypothetical protein